MKRGLYVGGFAVLGSTSSSFRGKNARGPCTIRRTHTALEKAAECKPIEYPKAGWQPHVSTGSRRRFFYPNTNHEGETSPATCDSRDPNATDQPESGPVRRGRRQPTARPGVYEIVRDANGRQTPGFKINAQNLRALQDLRTSKDPSQNRNIVLGHASRRRGAGSMQRL